MGLLKEGIQPTDEETKIACKAMAVDLLNLQHKVLKELINLKSNIAKDAKTDRERKAALDGLKSLMKKQMEIEGVLKKAKIKLNFPDRYQPLIGRLFSSLEN